MAPRTSVPILLLTGFLGSGKTSLLARWLREPEFSGAMVIVNELGEVGLDDRLVETSSEAPLLLDNGCACCVASEDLAATLERLFFDRLHRRIPKFSWVLIETTGIAEPQPIVDLIARNELVAERYHLEAVVTCFDARRGPQLLATQPECRRQVEAASTIVLTKTDLVDAADRAFALAALERLRPHPRVLVSSKASLSAADLVAELAQAKVPQACALDHAHGPQCGHDHPPAQDHLAGISTAFAPVDTIARPVLEAALEIVLNEFGSDLLRVKGIVAFDGGADLYVVQAERGLPVDVTPLPARHGAGPVTGMTLIARGTPAQHMVAALQSCILSASFNSPEGTARHV